MHTKEGINAELVRSLSDEAAHKLYEALVPMSLGRGEIIFSEGDVSDGIYFVAAGKVKLGRLRTVGGHATSGRESLLRIIGPNGLFGELSALDGGARSATATTITPVQLHYLSQERLDPLLQAHPEVATLIMRHLSSRLRWADLVLAGLSLNDVTGRVAATLLYLAESLGQQGREGIVVNHDLTQAELAAMVGATRETVNRTLTELASRGIIVNGVRKVVILDIDRLRQRIL